MWPFFAVVPGVRLPVRVLYQLSRDFLGFTAGAMLDDAKLGIRHLTQFEKIAVVTDANWISRAVQFFSLFYTLSCQNLREQ
ncbi:MAG: STAS/SEC14 domain-containing protein [Syntrophales bacterium]